jgi:hypothetical protein
MVVKIVDQESKLSFALISASTFTRTGSILLWFALIRAGFLVWYSALAFVSYSYFGAHRTLRPGTRSCDTLHAKPAYGSVGRHHGEVRSVNSVNHRSIFAARWLACGLPVNASSRTSRCATHDSKPVWFAIPFLLGTFTFALCRSAVLPQSVSLRFRNYSKPAST